MAQRITISGSELNHRPGGGWSAANADQQITATILIRRPPGFEDLSQDLLAGTARKFTRDEAEAFLRVNPADLTAVVAFAQNSGLSIVAENAEARSVQVQGSVSQIGQAFGVEIAEHVDPEGREYLSYEGALSVPPELAGIVEAVLGLDQRPLARRGVGS